MSAPGSGPLRATPGGTVKTRTAPAVSPSEVGLIGSLEADVLASLRQLKEAPARDVRTALRARGVHVAYTTVATILGRLWNKGLVRRRRETCRGGERYVYRPVDFERKYIRGLLKGVVSLFGPSGVVHLSEELSKLNPAEERELRRRLGL